MSAPVPGTDISLEDEFVRIVLVSNWTTGGPRPSAAVLVRREPRHAGREYAVFYVTDLGDRWIYTKGEYDLTAREGARAFDSRAHWLEVGD